MVALKTREDARMENAGTTKYMESST